MNNSVEITVDDTTLTCQATLGYIVNTAPNSHILERSRAN